MKKLLTILLTVLIALTTITFNVAAEEIDTSVIKEDEIIINNISDSNDEPELGYVDTIYIYYSGFGDELVFIDATNDDESGNVLTYTENGLSSLNVTTRYGSIYDIEDIRYITLGDLENAEEGSSKKVVFNIESDGNKVYLYEKDASDIKHYLYADQENSLLKLDSNKKSKCESYNAIGQATCLWVDSSKYVYKDSTSGDWTLTTTTNNKKLLKYYFKTDIYRCKYTLEEDDAYFPEYESTRSITRYQQSTISYKLPQDPIRPGYSFDGWYDKKTGKLITEGTHFDKENSYELFARWTKCNEYTLLNEDLFDDDECILVYASQGRGGTSYNQLIVRGEKEPAIDVSNIDNSNVIDDSNSILIPENDDNTLIYNSTDSTLKYKNHGYYINDIEGSMSIDITNGSVTNVKKESGLLLVGEDKKQVKCESGKSIIFNLVDEGGNVYIYKLKKEKPAIETISVDVEDKEYVYCGSAIEPNVIFTDSNSEELTLTKGVDYTVTYSNNINASRLMSGSPSEDRASITVTLLNDDYTFGEDTGNEITITFEIKSMPLFINLDKEEVVYGSDIPSILFKDSKGNPISLDLLDEEADLDESNGYQVTYFNKKYESIDDIDSEDIIDKNDIKNVGEYSVLVKVSRNYHVPEITYLLRSGAKIKRIELLTFKITANVIDYSKLVKDLVKTNLEYNGRYQAPIDPKDLPIGVEYANVLDDNYRNLAVDANEEYTALLKITDESSIWSEDAKDHIVTIDDKEYAEVSWSIAKKEATVKVEPSVITYGDKEPTYKLTGEGFVGKEFNTIKKSLKTSREPGTNVGQYEVTAYDASKNQYATRNYNVTYVGNVLTIVQKELPIPKAKNNLVYTGKVQAGFNDLSYLKDIVKITGQTQGTDARTYETTFELTNSNYKWVGTDRKSVKVSFTISPAKLDVTIKLLEFIYNGKDQVPTVTLKANGKTIRDGYQVVAYSYDKGRFSNDVKNVGDKYVTVVLLTNNYTFDGLKSDNELPREINAVGETYTKQYKIIPATVVASISNKDKSIVYDGEAHKPLVTVTVTTGDNKGTTLNSASYSTKYPNDVTNVGDKTITISLYTEASRNYDFIVSDKATDTVTLGYSITPKKVKVAWSKDTSFVYNGKEQKPTVSIVSGIVTKDIKTIGVDSYVTRAYEDRKVNSIDVGKYVVHAELTGDKYGNYVLEDSFSYPITKYFNITPKKATLHWENLEYVYDGKAHSPHLVITGAVERDYITYIQLDLPSGDMPGNDELKEMLDKAQRSNEALIRFADAGHYYTFGFILGNTDNYIFEGVDKVTDDVGELFGIVSTFTEFDIYPRQLKVTWGDKVKFRYDGKEHAPEIISVEAINDDNGDTTGIVDRDIEFVKVDYDNVNGKKVKVGKYYAEATLYSTISQLTKNYDIVENKTIDFKIYRKPNEDITPVKTGVER